MIPLLIVVPLATVSGGLLGYARNRLRRKRLASAIRETTASDSARTAAPITPSAIVAGVVTGWILLVEKTKGVVTRARVQIKRTGDRFMFVLSRIGEKSGAFGSVISAMGCAVCFPALASLGAAMGLGFLTRWEDLFMSTLIPLFAGVALLANALGWFSHRQWHRSLLGMVGPALILLSLYLWINDPWFRPTLFLGLFLMVAAAIWDLIWPGHHRCEIIESDSPDIPAHAV